MRCPACGFVSFDHLTACKKCGKELPPPPGGRRMPAPTHVAGFDAAGQPAAPPAGPAESFDSFLGAGAGDATTETMVTGGPARGPAAPSASPEDTFSFTLPPAASAPARGTLFEPGPGAEAEAEFRPAGFWIRFAAAFVDGLILWALTYPVTMIMGLREFAVTPGDPWGMFTEVARQATLQASVNMLIGLLYSVGFVGWRGQTPGKILLKLKIIRADGGDVDFLKAFIRWIGYLVSAIPLGIGFIMAAFTTNKRALHDLIAGTRVIRL